MSTTTHDNIAQALVVALDRTAKAKHTPAKPEDNPLHAKNLVDLIRGGGILKHADLLPQRDKHGSWMGPHDLNQQVIDGLDARSNGRKDQRKKVARARAQRKQQIDAIAESPKVPDPVRLAKAWVVLRPMVPIYARIARSKGNWAKRYLGTINDDIAANAVESTVKVLAKGDQDLDLLALAAQQLAGEAERTGLPGDQKIEEVEVDEDAARKQRRKEAKARKWLMGLANNRVMGALCDAYTEKHNLKWENLDVLETVMASINGAGDDPMMARFHADRAPQFITSRMYAPGTIDPDVLAMAIAGAITDRRLDRLVMLLTDEDNLRTDGAFMWTKNAEAVFLATENGEQKWAAVVQATALHQNPEHSRAYAARTYVRDLFAFLPWLVRSVIEACTVERIGWRDGRALMASAYDPDAFAEDGSRKRPGYLFPTPVYATTEEAARAIQENLSRVIAEYA